MLGVGDEGHDDSVSVPTPSVGNTQYAPNTRSLNCFYNIQVKRAVFRRESRTQWKKFTLVVNCDGLLWWRDFHLRFKGKGWCNKMHWLWNCVLWGRWTKGGFGLVWLLAEKLLINSFANIFDGFQNQEQLLQIIWHIWMSFSGFTFPLVWISALPQVTTSIKKCNACMNEFFRGQLSRDAQNWASVHIRKIDFCFTNLWLRLARPFFKGLM